MDIIKIKNLSFSYSGSNEKALDDISISVKKGDFVILCGESGCGKTTLLRLLKRELAPHGILSGEITEYTSSIGFVSQNPDTQIITDKVYNELTFGLENMGLSKNEILRRAGETAGFFGIHNKWRFDTDKLSGGEKQLLNLASVMVTEPDLLILDEPTSQLDPIAASEFLELLLKLNRDLGITIILSEHRLEQIFSLADKIIVMNKGELLLKGSPKKIASELRDHKNHAVLPALPAALRIFEAFKIKDDPPITIKEGKQFLTTHFKCDIKSLPISRTLNESAISLKKAYFRYEKKSNDIINNATLKVNKGEIFCILGQNGSGKTTLLKILSGLLKPYSGRLSVAKGLKISMLPQNPQSVFMFDKVCDELKEISGTKIPQNIIDLFSLSNLLSRHPYDLSGGEMQKTALAKILLTNPNILLLDEPAKGIDASAKLVLCEILKQVAKSGMSIIIVTHDIEFAASVSDKCALFFDGKILAPDSPSVFFSKNNFYTTAAGKISRHMFDGAVTCDDVIKLCRMNGELSE